MSLELVQLSIFHLINVIPGFLINFDKESGSQFSDGALDLCRRCFVQAAKADSITVSPSPSASANIDNILSFARRCIGGGGEETVSSSPSSWAKDGRVPVFLGKNMIFLVADGRAGGGGGGGGGGGWGTGAAVVVDATVAAAAAFLA